MHVCYCRFPGQDTFSGRLLHSVEYKDAATNGLVGKKPLVIGIGNSALDVVVDLYTRGACKPVRHLHFSLLVFSSTFTVAGKTYAL